MLIKALTAMEDNTKPYPERIRTRMLLNLVMAFMGALALTLALLFRDKIVSDFLAGFYTGTGVAFAGSGIALWIMNKIALKNEDKMKKKMISETDERNRYILQKSSGVSFFATAFSLYAALLVAGFYDLMVFKTLVCVILLMSLVFIISNRVVAART